MSGDKQIEAFIERWRPSGGAERSNAQPFLNELCDLLGVPKPDTAGEAYIFERPITFRHSDGTTSPGRIDLYKRGCFVLEAKQGSDQKSAQTMPLFGGNDDTTPNQRKGTAVRGTKGWDDAMVRARGQAEGYAKALPASEGWPPFLIVADVGHVFELFADFTGTGKHYAHFPDVGSFRIKLDDLKNPDIRERLRLIWTEPLRLDPSIRSAKVTQEIAKHLADLARSLEADGHDAKRAAMFLMRCLFTMFAEDVDLLPKGSFTDFLKSIKGKADTFLPMTQALWHDMNNGSAFSPAIRAKIRHFNGGLFKNAEALPINEAQLDLLIEAAKADWKDVEPAIFGTLLENALDALTRSQFGVHYTPRAYVERLVLPTVIEPLRDDWNAAKAAAVNYATKGEMDKARAELRKFHSQLCQTTVLDPACGTGNFLYVTMEHMKRIEGEVLDLLHEMGEQSQYLRMESHTVEPRQFAGIEVNEKAASIAELVLWIGYLQGMARMVGLKDYPDPVLKAYDMIENRDAVLAWTKRELERGEKGKPVSRWDGRSYKTDPVTGQSVPDETKQVEQYIYHNPKAAKWPKADFIVGNPPFIGGKDIRDRLGGGYAEALWAAHAKMPKAADFVMYWWNHAAELVRTGKARRFGFITTNSLTQVFNRKVIEAHKSAKKPISLLFAIPDHPWADGTGAANVRIAMTVGGPGKQEGLLLISVGETPDGEGAMQVELSLTKGVIHPDLTMGADTTQAVPLKANDGLCSPGVKLHGAGFIVTPEQAQELGLGRIKGLENHIRPYRNGRDLAAHSREAMVIDLFGLSSEEVRKRFPEVYQWLLERVKPERDQNNRATYKDNWWIFGEPRKDLRPALKGLPRFIATVETAKHRWFTFLDASICPDNKLVNIALDDAYFLGVLSSRIHVLWAVTTGGRLGVGNDPVYVKSACFDKFPFPVANEKQKANIRALGEEIDAHRKQRFLQFSDLTMTGLYNVLEALRKGDVLTPDLQEINRQGLVSVLKELHDKLDAAVADAYGWPVTLSDEDILARLAGLNAERASEEEAGQVRWLRPDFQAPGEERATVQPSQISFVMPDAEEEKGERIPWPKTMSEQVQAVRVILLAAKTPLDLKAIAKGFKGAPKEKLQDVLNTLVELSQVRAVGGDLIVGYELAT
ncbi:MAG: class I SAM-dependent DNA methyltransferase [Alphaproteobacteria bacterium]|nr:class I SAM-dependent DNA methyltransferase [Alphaproteobacteria bacterium]